jgi:hypothetical protein
MSTSGQRILEPYNRTILLSTSVKHTTAERRATLNCSR